MKVMVVMMLVTAVKLGLLSVKLSLKDEKET